MPSMGVALAVAVLSSCQAAEPPNVPLPATPQRDGDPNAGYDYLIYGDYVGAGIPLDVFREYFGGSSSADLGRTGDADGIPFTFNVIERDGAKLVAPTCLTCHAQGLLGELVVGLGNNSTDYSQNQATAFFGADNIVRQAYGEDSPEWRGYIPLSRAYKAISKYIVTKARGVNPADKIFAVLSAHRDPTTLEWSETPLFELPREVVPTDVPAWWLMKKKHALYYNGLGRGDFGRLSSASGLLTMAGVDDAVVADAQFPDLMAWIRTIEAPPYPFEIDTALAAQGAAVFERTCMRCHGTYGADDADDSYPNFLVPLEVIGTDAALSEVYATYPQYHTWYNESWFAQGDAAAQLLPNAGYVAPPLDGVWATAPYLHNGSVPTIADLLNSKTRPVYFQRSIGNTSYDQAKLGWNYQVKDAPGTSAIYDTTQPGYGNGGHTFGDELSDRERTALLEYLKTL